MRRTLVFVLLVLLGARSAFAQASDLVRQAGPRLEPGVRILVLTKGGDRIDGRVRTLTDASLSVDTSGGLVDLPTPDVGRIVIKDSIRNGTLIGLGAGATLGGLTALLLNALCETGDCANESVAVLALYTAAGAGIGAGIDGLIHRTVWDTMARTPGIVTSEVVAHVGANHTDMLWLPAHTGPSLGAGWMFRHENGLALELEFGRTFGDSSRLVPCTQLEPFGPGSGCSGEGRQGLAGTTTGSATVHYFFSKGRVQPYLSGGFAIVSQRFQDAQASRVSWPDGEIVVFQSSHLHNRGALVAGGGLRFELGPRLSLRPGVTVYAGDEWTQVRAGVGLGFDW